MRCFYLRLLLKGDDETEKKIKQIIQAIEQDVLQHPESILDFKIDEMPATMEKLNEIPSEND